MRKTAVVAASLALAVLGAPWAAHADLETVAKLREPSAIPGFIYKQLGHPQAGDVPSSAVAFLAKLKGGSRTHCILRLDASGSGQAVACKDDPSPTGGTFSTMSAPSMNSSGVVAWSAQVRGVVPGIFKRAPGGLITPVAQSGDAVDGGGSLSRFGRVVVTDSEAVVFLAAISNDPNPLTNQAIFRCDGDCTTGPGTRTVVVRKGATVPDHANREFCSLQEFDASDWGVVVRASTKMDCTNPLENGLVGLFRYPFSGTPKKIAMQGDASNPPGTTYAQLPGVPSIDNAGHIAFRANVNVGEDALETVFFCRNGDCPGTPALAAVPRGTLDDAGNALQGFSDPAVASGGDLAFTAKGRKGHCGVYIRRVTDGDIVTVAVKGTEAPGVPGSAIQCSPVVSMSSGGNVAFDAKYKVTKGKPGKAIFFFSE